MKRIITLNIDTKSRTMHVNNEWDESKHKRDDDGKFTSGGSGKSATSKSSLYEKHVIDGVHWNHRWTPGDSPASRKTQQLEKDFIFYKNLYETAAKYDSEDLNEIKDRLWDVHDELLRRKNGGEK